MFIGKKSIQKFNLNKPEKNFIVNVEKAVKGVRPYTVCAVAKDLKLDDSKIKELIDLQEKLHGSIGRKRKKLAIGIYPLDKIKFPIRFTSKRFDEISFVPLESKKEMNAKSILKKLENISPIFQRIFLAKNLYHCSIMIRVRYC